MTVIGESASQILEQVEGLLRSWLSDEGAEKVDIEYIAVALTSTYVCWIEVDDEWSRSHLPSEISFAMHDLRAAQADPHRGAWLCSHLWMEVAEGVLHQESDWMREPLISGEPIRDGNFAFELDQFPRDPEWIPEWMATKAAAYHQEKERRERRRQRERERRAKKKAEAAQVEGDGADEPDSGRVGRSGDE